MNTFLIIANKKRDKNLEITNKIIEFLEDAGKEVVLHEAYFYEQIIEKSKNKLSQENELEDIINKNNIECTIVLGGDGTIIHAANYLRIFDIPILGVNLGTLGFLAEVEEHNIYTSLERLFKGEYSINNRMMICGELNSSCSSDGNVEKLNFSFSNHDQMKPLIGYALNDIVITRKGFSRIINLSVYVNDDLVDHYRGDGVIISTPTGSTGYNLSAGGPVISPEEELMIITPICCHSLGARSIVVSQRDTIKVVVGKSRKTQETEAIATFDGDKVLELDIGDVMIINKSKHSTKLIKLNDASIYEVLRTKLSQNYD